MYLHTLAAGAAALFMRPAAEADPGCKGLDGPRLRRDALSQSPVDRR